MDLLQRFHYFLLAQKKKPSKATIKNYKADIGQFIRWVETRTNRELIPASITPQILELYKKYKTASGEANELSARSVDRHLSSLRKFFQFLAQEKQISENPFDKIQAASLQAAAKEDPWLLKNFKNYLYVYNASHLTIKNYIIDVRQFLDWAEEVTGVTTAWNVKDKNVFKKISPVLVEEYKRRLLHAAGLSPLSINRKLSSIRKYIQWAQKENLIKNWELGIRNYAPSVIRDDTTDIPCASIPPIRLLQKISKSIDFLFDASVIALLARSIEELSFLSWKAKGKPVFRSSKMEKEIAVPKVSNISKSFYAPTKISTQFFPFHKKILWHIQHNRPEWYKRAQNTAFFYYFRFAVLVIFFMAITLAGYKAFFEKPVQEKPVLAAAVPNRILSFQGRLTDSSNNPITTKKNVRFIIYIEPTASGSARQWEELDTVTPDADGIFSVFLGFDGSKNNATTCGLGSPATRPCGIPQSLFAQYGQLWLGVTIGNDSELTPRQQLATVAYATNAEVLQGLPPTTDSAWSGGTANTNAVLALNASGTVAIPGSASTTLQATGGQFVLSGQSTLIQSNSGSAGNVVLNPDGLGKIDLQKPLQNTTNNNNITTAAGAVEVDDMFAILATSSGQSAFTINQNSTGPLISASSSGTAKFTLDYVGNGYFAGNVGIATTAPDAALEINHATGDSLRLTYNDSDGSATNFTDFSLSSTGALTLTGSAATLADSASAEKTFFTITPGTITLTGTTTVSSVMETAILTGATIAASAATTVTDAANLSLTAPVDSTNATLTRSSALRINDTSSGAGTLTSLIGLYIAPQTGGATNNYGLCFDCDGTYSSSTVASGIQFGTDANAVTLYRSASDTLRTGDNLTVDLDLEVTDGDITTAATTATVFNTNATTLSLGGAATTALNLGNGSGNYTAINLGSGSGTHTINIAGTGATAADTINIGTGGTGADTINIGSSASTTSLAVTTGTGAQTFTSSVATTGTTSSAWVFSDASLSSGTGIYLTATGLTSGTGVSLIPGTAMTTGSALSISSATYVHTASNDIGSLLSLSFTDASTNINSGGTTNGINIASTINTSGAGTKSINAINIASPTKTACTTGACTWTGLAVADPGTLANTTFYAATFAGGNVGIGTTSPQSALDVNGILTVRDLSSGHALVKLNTTDNNKYAYMNFGDGSTYGWQVGKDIDSGGLGGANGFYIYELTTGQQATRFAINKGGNVGIGDADPTEAQLVIGSAGAGNVFLTLSTTGTTNDAVCWDALGATLLYDCDSTPADYAENYPVEQGTEYGDIVTIGSQDVTTKIGTKVKQLVRSSTPYDNKVIGITSDNYHDFTSAGKEEINSEDNPMPVALNGRVPVKVSSLSDPIEPGDLITSSSEPGKGMKATRAGFMVGKALESWSPGSGKDKIMIFVSTSYADPDSSGNVYNKIVAFAEATIGKVRAGLLEAERVATNSLTITTENMMIAGVSLQSYVSRLVDERLISNTTPILSPIASIDQLKVNTISPLASDTITVNGNASISGQLKTNKIVSTAVATEQLTVNNDATISGTLRAKTVIADQIEGLEARVSSIAAETIASNKYQVSTDLANVENFIASFGQFNQGLIALGPTSLTDTAVAGQLSISGKMLLTDNTINTLGTTLELQPLRQGGLSIMAGLVYIDTDGNAQFGGDAAFAKDVTVKGKLAANIISPLASSDLSINLGGNDATASSLLVNNASGSGILKVDQKGNVTASGSGSFASIIANALNIVRGVQADTSLTETVASGSAGTATIIQGETERTIINTSTMTDRSLVYLSPASDTLGLTPYVARQTKESFTIQIPQYVNKDIKINWWIVN